MAEVDDAARAALDGRLIVLPTDTVYGIGTRPDAAEATGRLFEAKKRPRHLVLPVLAASADEAGRIGRLGGRGLALAERFWPGPLTLVVHRTDASASWSLGGDGETIGLRVPGHPLAREVLLRTGALAVTSANVSGEPTPARCQDVRAIFGEAVEVYVCASGSLDGTPSTVVDLTGDSPVVLREGTDARHIERWLAKNPELDTQNGTT